MVDPVLGVVITIVLVLANGFFVAAEFAIVKVRASQIELRVLTGSKTAKMSHTLITHLDAYLSATQLGITLASLGLGWVGEPIVSKLIVGLLRMFGYTGGEELAHAIALPVAFVVITVLHIVLGELAPKSLAIQRPEQTTLAIAYPLRFFYILLRPFIVVLNGLANWLLRFAGIQPAGAHEHAHSNEEIRLLLEQSREGGTIEDAEHELLENVFEFRDKIVKEVMVPRTEIVALDASEPADELAKTIIEDGYTRMPVYNDSLDEVIGFVYSKDLITLKEHSDLIILEDLLRPVYFVPETKPIADLLREFQRRKIHLAIVVDEFGGTAGIVTLEDILEELVGEIQDEYDDEPVEVEQIDDGVYIVNASISVADANDEIVGFVLPEGEDYTSVGGLVTKWFGRIPLENESFERDQVKMTVLKTSNNRIEQVQIEDLNRNELYNGLEAFKEEEE
ncbi:MAG: hemolysin family protein [Candidatus Kapaibacterium sp.]